MKINEIIANAPHNSRLQPSVVKRQGRVNKVVAQIAASDQQWRPAENVLAVGNNFAVQASGKPTLVCDRMQTT